MDTSIDFFDIGISILICLTNKYNDYFYSNG
jgi:hypothetical protein